MQALIERVKAMLDEQLLSIWEALKEYNPAEEYSPGITMDDWASLIYSELSYREL
jgi:hypothetical protein